MLPFSKAEGSRTCQHYSLSVWGEGEPLALLSMPVRLLCRLTGTALRAAFRSRSAVDARKAPASPVWGEGEPLRRRGRCSPSPPSPPSLPQRAFTEGSVRDTNHPAPTASGTCTSYLSYCLKLFVKTVLSGPDTSSDTGTLRTPTESVFSPSPRQARGRVSAGPDRRPDTGTRGRRSTAKDEDRPFPVHPPPLPCCRFFLLQWHNF